MRRLYLPFLNLYVEIMRHLLTEKMMVRIMKKYIWYYAKYGKKVQDSIIWGNTPVVNIKYWSNAVKKSGYKSYTLVPSYLGSINKKSDFDFYHEDVWPKRFHTSKFWNTFFYPKIRFEALKEYWVILHIMKYAKIYHHYFDGGPFARKPEWKDELKLLKLAGVKVIGTAFGSDFYMYSTIQDLSIRHVLNMFYPYFATGERLIKERVEYYHEHLDAIVGGFITDGRGRWDLLLTNPLCIDTEAWSSKPTYSQNDGRNGVVKLMHLSNHKPYTGTDFIIRAVEELKDEGLLIDFFYPEERIQNDEVRERLNNIDIYIDGIVFTGYGLASIEVMAKGNCSIVNLENEALIQVFRRYSWLNECPLFSASPETIKDRLRTLITNPALRETLGRAGRQYVEKYHSEKNTQFWFNHLYDKLIHHKKVDFGNLYNPLDKNSYNNSMPLIQHPLIYNKLPKEN